MLTALSIRNVVLIEALELQFEHGLTALTGETGAGKSILLDALTMSAGARSDKGLVRKGADKAQSTASFYLPPTHAVYSILAEAGIETDTSEDLTLRREVRADGRSKAYISDTPVSIKLLSQIGMQLIEVHGQNDGRGLLDPSTHLSLLDEYADHEDLLEACAKRHITWRESTELLGQLEAKDAKATDDRAFIEHAIAELNRLEPKEDEEEELAQSRRFLQAAEGAIAELSQAQVALSDTGVVEQKLSTILSSLERVIDKLSGDESPAAQSLGQASRAIERTLIEFQEARQAIDTAALSFNVEPGELDRIERRLFDLRGAARKYGVSVAALAAHRIKLSHELEQLENISENIAKARVRAEKAGQAYHAAAKKLSKSRQSAAARLDQHVLSELPTLKMDRAQFLTQIETGHESALGCDKVRFVVATNPGSAMGHLDKVASGGEMSRFALAIKVALAGDSAPVMVFDEVDQGVGGAVADAIGRRLSDLSTKGQVFVVTHSPQVAAKANQQYRIDKQGDERMTRTSVNEVVAAEREEEIARMLAGEIITDEARAAARKLMQVS
ncbi:MAG: DNA repair protein RecN [Maricaulaceae bacterium]